MLIALASCWDSWMHWSNFPHNQSKVCISAPDDGAFLTLPTWRIMAGCVFNLSYRHFANKGGVRFGFSRSWPCHAIAGTPGTTLDVQQDRSGAQCPNHTVDEPWRTLQMIPCESDKASEGTVLLRRLPSEFFDATLQLMSARQLKTCRPQRTEVWSARWLQLCALGDLWITTPLFRTPMRCQVTVQISDCLTPRMRCRISSCKSREWLSRLHTAGLFFHGTSPEVSSPCPRSNLKNTSSINHTVKIRHSQNASCSRPH